MPIYEYQFDNCGEVFECLCFRSDEKDLVPCSSCGGRNTRKVMSTFSCGSMDSGSGTSLGSSCGSTGGFS